MRLAGIVITSLVALGAIAWWIARDVRVPASGGPSTTTSSDAANSAASESPPLDGLPATVADGRDTDAAPPASDTAPRELALQAEPIHASHALAPDEPTVVKGRVIDRNGAKQAGCRVLSAPRVTAPDVGLKPGRSWPLDAIAIDRDGTRERLRTGRRDADLDRDDETMRVRQVVTDGDGRFEFRGLPSGPIRLAFRSADLAPRDLDDLVLEARATLDLGDLALDFPLVLEGEVFDSEGRAIAGARIDRVDLLLPDALQPGPAIAAPLAITAANGHFRTTPLAFGSWSLLATHPEYLAQRIDGATEVAARAPAPIVFTLPSATALVGNVFGPAPEELATLCVIAAPERTWRDPVELREGELSADSTRLGANADQRSARVASDGRFRLSGLDPARAHILRVGPLAPSGDELACTYLTVRTEAGVREIDLALAQGGVVSFEARSQGTYAPVEDFDVWIAGAAPETLVDEHGVALRHHAGGAFRLTNVRFPGPPPQQLTIAALGHAISTVDLYAESGSDVALGALALEPLDTLEVVVTDATTGSTIEGARVRASEEEPERSRRLGWPSGTTDRKGLARVTSYAESGSYVCVDADGFASQCIGFGDVGWDSRDGRCEVRLAAGSRVRVHVDDREGAPAPGVSVAATSDLAHSRAVSDAQGIAVFEHLPSGVTQFGCVQLRKRSPEASTEANVGRAGELDVWITSPGVGDLVGRVLDGARTVVGAELTLRILDASEWKHGRRVDGGIVGSTRSDATGAYRFENVELGPVSIDVSLDRSLAPIGFELVVEAPQTRFDVDLAGAHLRGRVLDSRGRGQPDAIVWFASVEYRTPLDRGFVDSLPAARTSRDGEGRRTPCFTTDSYGGFDVWMPRDAGEFVVSASHTRGGAGWTRVARGSDAAPDVEVRLAPAGELELQVAGTRSRGLVVLLPEAEPSAWLVRDVRFDETTRWDALAAGEWRAWRVSAWLDQDGEVGSAASREPTLFKIEPGRRTQVTLPLK